MQEAADAFAEIDRLRTQMARTRAPANKIELTPYLLNFCQPEEVAGRFEQHTGRAIGEIKEAWVWAISAGEPRQRQRL